MSEGLLVVDTEDRIRVANRRVADLLTASPREIQGRSIREFLDRPATSLYEAHTTLGNGTRTSRFEWALRDAEGHSVDVLASIRPVVDARGRSRGTYLILTPIPDASAVAPTRPEGESRLHDIVEHSTNFLYACTPDHVLTYVSPQAQSFFGCPPDVELTSWRPFITDHPANREALERARLPLEAGEAPPAYDLELRRSDGRTLWVEVNETPVLEQGQTISITGSLTDITERRRVEELLKIELELGSALGAVRTVQESLRHTLEAALRVDEVDAGALYVLDPDSGDMLLARHTGLSKAYATKIARISATTPHGSLVRRTSRRGLELVDENAIQEGLRTTIVLPIRHEGQLLACLDLASRTVDAFPSIALNALRTIAGQLGPVISRFETQSSLEKSESTLRSLISSAPAGIGLVRERVFQWINDHMTRLTGYPRRELIGRSARLLYESDEEFTRVGIHMQDLSDHAVLGTVETKWKRRDGTVIDVLLSAAGLDRSTASLGMVFTAWDVTERNHTEAERRHLESQVQQAQKLESLGMLAGGIAHDFNNILHAIMGHASMAGTCLSDPVRADTHLDAIERAATRAGELCRQMLAYSGRGSFVIERVHLGEVVRDLASMVDVSLSKKTELCVDVDSDSLPIEADASQMRQVVLNLITNAAEAIGNEAGLVRVTVAPTAYSEERLHAEYWQAGLAAGTYVVLAVEDNGCGMDDETRERIFEPFFTTKFTGRGLGLAAIQGIVRGHGGAIRVTSEPGRGTTVTVLVPPASGKAKPQRHVERRTPANDTRGLILLADDEPRVREVGSLMLESAGFEVVAVGDGQEAVDVFRERPGEFQCVILDLTMPVIDGEEAFRELRRIRSDVPVILCSGYSQQELHHRFDGDQPTGFLEKPFSSDALLGMLGEVLSTPR